MDIVRVQGVIAYTGGIRGRGVMDIVRVQGVIADTGG